MSAKVLFGIALSIIVVVAVLTFAPSGNCPEGIPDAGEVRLMAIASEDETRIFTEDGNKDTVQRVLIALKGAKRGAEAKLYTYDYVLFHLRSGNCAIFGVGLLHDKKTAYVVDSEGRGYYSKNLYSVLYHIYKSKENLYKDPLLPKYEVDIFKVHYPADELLVIDKAAQSFSVLVEKAQEMMSCVSIVNRRPEWPEDDLMFYDGKGDIGKELAESGGVEVLLRDPIIVPRFEIEKQPGTGMSYRARYLQFKCDRIVMLEYPRFNEYVVVSLSSADDPDQYFVFLPFDKKVGEAGYFRKVWDGISDILETIRSM